MTKIKKPSEVRDEISVLRSAIHLSEIVIRTWVTRSDKAHYLETVSKQVAIIREARCKIKQLTTDHQDAPMKIIELQHRIAHLRKRLIVLENYALIRKLESVTTELDTVLKETTDEQDSQHS